MDVASLLFACYAVSAAICGGVGCYVSGQKHRPTNEGLILGLLLGPVGVIVAACLPTLSAPAELAQPPAPPVPAPPRPPRPSRVAIEAERAQQLEAARRKAARPLLGEVRE